MAAIALPRARFLCRHFPARVLVLGIDNPGGLLLDGGCCGSRCPGRCNTYFRLCLKEYQAQVDLSGACTFGNLTSPLIGGSSFSLQTHPDQQLLLRLPFHFRWTTCMQDRGTTFRDDRKGTNWIELDRSVYAIAG
ncbi:hypothetical protein MRX96_031973 [Rhipicephalus microplus]